MIATFKYTDGTTSDPIKVSFNPDTNAGQSWQYTAQVMVAHKAYDSITVSVAYDYNVNTVYFDGIQLYKEEFGSSYTYDEDGNITSVVDLQKQKTSYDYTDNDLTQMIMPTGATYTYKYDNYHNVETATTELGLVYRFEYDDYGNNTSVSIGSGENTMSSSADYTDDGNRIDFTTDALGKITTYGYNEQTNMLDWVKYPNDTDATKTVYDYDAMCRMSKVFANVDNDDTEADQEMYVVYTYDDNDRLAQVETPTTAYDFTYGDFGLRNTVKIGIRPLATYYYTDSPNFYLEKLDYGNDGEVQYEYDNKGRLIRETYEDGDKVTYLYDNDGALASMTDSATGITTQYFYDFTGRTVKYVETGTDYSHSVEYTYDDINNLSMQVENYGGSDYITSYAYDADNRVTAKTTDGITVEYTYDGLGRVTQQVTKNGDTTVKTETYTFNANSAQVRTYHVQMTGYTASYTYDYDDNGNIVSELTGGYETRYYYDSANQLIGEHNGNAEVAWTWAYDNAGNITASTTHDYTREDLGEQLLANTYSYDDEDWGDLLTAYDGSAITHDTIGNPLSDGTWTYTWEHGRELAAMSDGNATWTYTYDANGMRTKRTDGTAAGTYEYVYENGLLTRLTLEETREYMYFSYSAEGIPVSFVYDTDPYYYITNAQGDVVGIQDCDGNIVARYSYDAWGKPLTEFTAEEDHIAYYNPLRYRGYVYDQETGLYYLQSRYYDPAVGRFLNADAFASTGQGFTGNNMFAYCNNNPVAFIDTNGQFSLLVLGILVVGAAIGGYLGYTSEEKLWETPNTRQENDFAPNGGESEDSKALTTGDKIKNALIGASFGLGIGGLAVAFGGAVGTMAVGSASIYIPILGGTGLQTFARGALIYDIWAIIVTPFLGMEAEPIEIGPPMSYYPIPFNDVPGRVVC